MSHNHHTCKCSIQWKAVTSRKHEVTKEKKDIYPNNTKIISYSSENRNSHPLHLINNRNSAENKGVASPKKNYEICPTQVIQHTLLNFRKFLLMRLCVKIDFALVFFNVKLMFATIWLSFFLISNTSHISCRFLLLLGRTP